MPRTIDQDAFDELKILDINSPPTKAIAYEAFPKMVYLHPRDKSQEHLFKVVNTAEELEDAEKQGWKRKPHIPVAPVEGLSRDFEAEPVEERRGPGRPPKAA